MTQQIALTGSLVISSALSIERFDPALGTLTQVSLTYELLRVSSIAATRSVTSTEEVEYFDVASSLSLASYFFRTRTGNGLAIFPVVAGQPGLFDLNGTGYAYVTGKGLTTLSEATQMEPFVGSGEPNDVLQLTLSMTALTAPLPITQISSLVTGTLTVTYNYEASAAPSLLTASTPEPASMTVFGLLATTVSAARRRRSKCGQESAHRSARVPLSQD